MTTLNQALAALLCASLLRGALTMLLPEGSVKRYAQFVFGLATMALLLRPIFWLLNLLAEV